MILTLANTMDSVGLLGGGTALGVVVTGLGIYIFRPGWAFAGERAKAAEERAAADATIADAARAAHIESQAATISQQQATIATMQSTQGELFRDQIAQGRQIGKLEGRIASVERHNAELEEQLTARIRERDEAIATAAALQKVIDEKAATIASLTETNAEAMIDIERLSALQKAAEDRAGRLAAEVERLTSELDAKDRQIAGLQQSVADLQHTLNPAVPAATSTPECV